MFKGLIAAVCILIAAAVITYGLHQINGDAHKHKTDSVITNSSCIDYNMTIGSTEIKSDSSTAILLDYEFKAHYWTGIMEDLIRAKAPMPYITNAYDSSQYYFKKFLPGPNTLLIQDNHGTQNIKF